ncbi:MAG: chemotaxis protein CheX [Anaerohalosphaeraceae bacterium]
MLEQLTMEQTILDAAREVFETMIFMDIESAEAASQESSPEGAALMGSITFRGGLEGCLTICLSEACARSIAANMLGLDGGDKLSLAEVGDAVGEVANMTMGSIKHRIQNTYNDLQVSIPTVVSGRQLFPMPGEDFSRGQVCTTLDEIFPVTFSMYYKQTQN